MPQSAITGGTDDATHQLRGDAAIGERLLNGEGNFGAVSVDQGVGVQFSSSANITVDEIAKRDVAGFSGI
jgi:hypothetical protein